MPAEIDALVVRAVDYKEYDKILTVLARDEGKMTVSARGAGRRGSPVAAAAQLLCRSRMLLSEFRGRLQLKEAELLEGFLSLRGELESLALATYLADLAGTLMPEGQPAPEVFDLTVLALRALERGGADRVVVKGAFEMAALCLSGYAPALAACAVCGREPSPPALDAVRGTAVCAGCGGGALPLSRGAWDAVRHVARARLEKIFSFTLDRADALSFAWACEGYLRAQLDRSFATLDFYKGLTETI